MLSRRLLHSLSRALISSSSTSSSIGRQILLRFSSSSLADADYDSPGAPNVEENPSSSSPDSLNRRSFHHRSLENGLAEGVYKAILVGKAGQRPVQKLLRSGRPVVLFSLATGGIRNNRHPNEKGDPRERAEACAVQWHRISIYHGRLAGIAIQHIKPGSTLYIEGNLETKVFIDHTTGLDRQIREIAIRRDGRLVFLGGGDDSRMDEERSTRSVF